MAKGYPSRRRASRAFEWGVYAGFRRRNAAKNPYKNPRLRELWIRGYELGAKGREPRLRRMRYVGAQKGNVHKWRGGDR